MTYIHICYRASTYIRQINCQDFHTLAVHNSPKLFSSMLELWRFRTFRMTKSKSHEMGDKTLKDIQAEKVGHVTGNQEISSYWISRNWLTIFSNKSPSPLPSAYQRSMRRSVMKWMRAAYCKALVTVLSFMYKNFQKRNDRAVKGE